MRPVAVKFLHNSLLMNEEHRARFEREGRVLATCRIQIFSHSIGLESGDSYIHSLL